ncbi:hypothetical protein NBC2815_01884 [Xanthomonas fragariae]|nr:hypothetical protein NBC2815_01884 [Xanthomonas fragariae]
MGLDRNEPGRLLLNRVAVVTDNGRHLVPTNAAPSVKAADNHRANAGQTFAMPVGCSQAAFATGASSCPYLGGGGANTVRSPLCSGWLTTPAASIASIKRAARL